MYYLERHSENVNKKIYEFFSKILSTTKQFYGVTSVKTKARDYLILIIMGEIGVYYIQYIYGDF